MPLIGFKTTVLKPQTLTEPLQDINDKVSVRSQNPESVEDLEKHQADTDVIQILIQMLIQTCSHTIISATCALYYIWTGQGYVTTHLVFYIHT